MPFKVKTLVCALLCEAVFLSDIVTLEHTVTLSQIELASTEMAAA
jgi:hypothetical protein